MTQDESQMYDELGMDAGLSGGEILAHIADGLHNEARKTVKRLYPSQLGYARPDRVNLIVEITDVSICLDYLREVANIHHNKIDEHRRLKLEVLRRRALNGEYVMIGKRIYKKEARS